MGFFPKSSIQQTHYLDTLPKCGFCGLHNKCKSPRMKPTGRGKIPVLFVGEAPGEQEDKKGVQLIGESGQWLREVLGEIGFDLNDCWKTNVVVCRPPQNKMMPKYIECCRPLLLQTIKKLKPKVIILLGKSALDSLIAPEWGKDMGELSRWVGMKIPSPLASAWVCPTFHPAYVLRKGDDFLLRQYVKRHLKEAFNMLQIDYHYEPLETLKQQIHIEYGNGISLLKDLSRKEGTLAFDYETTGLKPDAKGHRIVSCSFCLNGEQTFALQITPEHYKYLSAILRSEHLKKVASNLKFEERWSRKILGHGVLNWYWDTMMAAHCLDNRTRISSIKFLSYLYLGVPDYSSQISHYLESKTSNGFNRIDEINVKDLLLYNGMDSLLEYKVMELQRKMFRRNK